MEFLKDFFNVLFGSFKKENIQKSNAQSNDNPFSNEQLLGVPESSIINPIEIQKKKKKLFYIIIIVIIIAIIIGIIAFFIVRSNYCFNIEKRVKEVTLNYAEDNDMLPIIEGEHIIINLKEIGESVKFNNKPCGGTVKITKYQDEYIQTLDVTDCNYCTTSKRYSKWSQETEKYSDKARIIDVIPYYNYRNVSNYDTAWTNWVPTEKVNKKEDEKYKVKLPTDLNVLPKLNENVEIVKYDVETKNYYSHRDKMWKFYKNNLNTYSGFSSTAPKGYPNKDSSTEIYTEPTAWSPDYPDEYDYRIIDKKTAYRWYYEEDKNKVYWNSGEYSPESPGEKYKKDYTDHIYVYSYKDRKWRWYYGNNKRYYSSYRSTATNAYKYKDSGISMYTGWTSFRNYSERNASNASYREEKINVHYRYRINYNIIYDNVLKNYVTKGEIEKTLDKPIEEIVKDPTIKLDVTYKFRYKK
ncbi:MAG: hypothetical protein PHD10_02260 [Bacilli bacterium]|nr:hypothetical protein [Bacilli bacterium]MDD4607936.1 hypothetical protein [Bacilli bacterium]